MSMTVRVNVDQKATLLAGKPSGRDAVITINEQDLATWSAEDRKVVADLLADHSQGVVSLGSYEANGNRVDVRTQWKLTVTQVNVEGVRQAALASLAKAQNEAAVNAAFEQERKAEYATKDADLAGGPIDNLLCCPYHDEENPWRLNLPYDAERNYPLTYARKGEAEAERDRRNREIATQRTAAKEARAAQQAAELETLRQWAETHGSDLTKARLAEGFPCWVSAAKEDQQRIAHEYADRIAEVGPEAEIPDGYDDFTEEPLLCPSLQQIEALRKIRGQLPTGVTAELMRLTYTLTEDDDLDEDTDAPELPPVVRVEIRLTIPHKFGVQHRYLDAR